MKMISTASTVLALLLPAAFASACPDLSGEYHNGNFTMNLKQSGCDSLDIVYKTAGGQPITENSDIAGKNGWTWSDGLLTWTNKFSDERGLFRTDIAVYSTDTSGNLVQRYSVNYAKGAPLLSQTVFKKNN